jgi:FixJ family two-component response regulator
MFRGIGVRAETFSSAEEYLHHSGLEDPSCIVLDVHLGGLTGFELQARLAAEGRLRPIIFITAHEICTDDLARCPGPCRYLRKPFDSDTLMALVLPHLNGRPPE